MYHSQFVDTLTQALKSATNNDPRFGVGVTEKGRHIYITPIRINAQSMSPYAHYFGENLLLAVMQGQFPFDHERGWPYRKLEFNEENRNDNSMRRRARFLLHQYTLLPPYSWNSSFDATTSARFTKTDICQFLDKWNCDTNDTARLRNGKSLALGITAVPVFECDYAQMEITPANARKYLKFWALRAYSKEFKPWPHSDASIIRDTIGCAWMELMPMKVKRSVQMWLQNGQSITLLPARQERCFVPPRNTSQENMLQIVESALLACVLFYAERTMAAVQSMHPRLGAKSRLHALDPAVMQMIIDETYRNDADLLSSVLTVEEARILSPRIISESRKET